MLRNIAAFVGAVGGGGALIYLLLAVSTPLRYHLAEASAIQATQAYTEGVMDGVIAVALLLLTLLCWHSLHPPPDP